MSGEGRSGCSRFTIIATLCGIALIAACVLALQWFLVEVPARGAERALDVARTIGTDIRNALQIQPQVVVRNKTVLRQETDLLEIVTVERQLEERYEFESSWLGSRKRLVVEGDFVVRGGFDLTRRFVVDVDADGAGARINLPPPQVISADMIDFRVVADESGLWNQLTEADREVAVEALREQALQAAVSSNLLVEAKRSAEDRIRRLLPRTDFQVKYQFAAPTPLP